VIVPQLVNKVYAFYVTSSLITLLKTHFDDNLFHNIARYFFIKLYKSTLSSRVNLPGCFLPLEPRFKYFKKYLLPPCVSHVAATISSLILSPCKYTAIHSEFETPQNVAAFNLLLILILFIPSKHRH
jgi:hypothetical protein